MRIGIVNDLPMAVEAVRRVLRTVPDYAVAWMAANGAEAVEKCLRDTPDLILMDLYMPVMDGCEATRRIMERAPCAILVVTATVDGHAARVFDAMGHGALDAVGTPVLGPAGDVEGGAELLRKIASIRRLLGASRAPWRGTPAECPAPLLPSLPPLVAIGASTGGPKAVAALLGELPKELGAAVLLIQHVDSHLAGGLVTWLRGQTGLDVELAEEGSVPRPNAVLVAGRDDHLVLGGDRRLRYTREPGDCPFRPSVDVLFESLAERCRGRVEGDVAVLLTGMGTDGARGMVALRQAGWHTIAQDRATSVVYGMPRAAAEAGGAVEVLPLQRMAARIAAYPRRRTAR